MVSKEKLFSIFLFRKVMFLRFLACAAIHTSGQKKTFTFYKFIRVVTSVLITGCINGHPERTKRRSQSSPSRFRISCLCLVSITSQRDRKIVESKRVLAYCAMVYETSWQKSLGLLIWTCFDMIFVLISLQYARTCLNRTISRSRYDPMEIKNLWN